ncbi:MAG TPA: GFA family protein [Hyphomicrobiales bacterium]|nr:GFA family protein [Hyphomicrobiales bacterium]
MTASSDMRWRRGGCHCGAVAFEVLAPAAVEVTDCNCSVCRMTGFQHLIVPQDRFRLLSGADKLTDYRFNTGTARHLFCAVCGIKSFYVPRSHPDGYSVNLRCLDAGEFARVDMVPFDGRHWEQHAAELRPLEAN